MTAPQWTWRERVRDPRYAGFLVFGVCFGFGVLIVRRSHMRAALVGASAEIVAIAVVGLVSLPPWRDPDHGPRIGGIIFAAGGLFILAGAAVAGFVFGVN